MFNRKTTDKLNKSINEYIEHTNDDQKCIDELSTLFLYKKIPDDANHALRRVKSGLENPGSEEQTRNSILNALETLLRKNQLLPSIGNENKTFSADYSPAQILVWANIHKSIANCINLAHKQMYKLSPDHWTALGFALKIMGMRQVNLSSNNLYNLSAEQWNAMDMAFKNAEISWVDLDFNALSMLLPARSKETINTFWSQVQEEEAKSPKFKAKSLEAMTNIILGNTETDYYLSNWCDFDDKIVAYLEQQKSERSILSANETSSSKALQAAQIKKVTPQDSEPKSKRSQRVKHQTQFFSPCPQPDAKKESDEAHLSKRACR